MTPRSRRGLLVPYASPAAASAAAVYYLRLAACVPLLMCPISSDLPLPLSLSLRLLKWALALFCYSLPFVLATELNWWTVPICTCISIAFYGLDEIGAELEQPFGTVRALRSTTTVGRVPASPLASAPPLASPTFSLAPPYRMPLPLPYSAGP